MFRYVRQSKNRDLVSVSRFRTSRCYPPFPPSTSRLRRLAPDCFNTAATPPAALPLGRCVLLIAWLDDRGCVRGCLCLSIGVSCLPPLSSRGHATPPAVFPVDSGINYVLPDTLISAGSVTDLPLGIALASASWSYTAQGHLPLVCGAVLCLCPAGSWVSHPFEGIGLVVG